MTLKTNATSISANAGHNMTIQGDYQGLVAATGNNMVINASINGGGLVAGEKIDYQSGKAYLSGLYAKETTVHKGVDLTLSYGYGGGDIGKGVFADAFYGLGNSYRRKRFAPLKYIIAYIF